MLGKRVSWEVVVLDGSVGAAVVGKGSVDVGKGSSFHVERTTPTWTKRSKVESTEGSVDSHRLSIHD